MFIPDPDFYPSRISDPGSQDSNKREGWKKIVVIPLYLATNFAKLNIILVLKSWRKKFGSIVKELFKFLPKKLSLSSQTNGFGIRDPGVKRHRIPDPDPQHCHLVSTPHWIRIFLFRVTCGCKCQSTFSSRIGYKDVYVRFATYWFVIQRFS